MIDDYDNEDYDYFKEWDIEQYKQEIEKLQKLLDIEKNKREQFDKNNQLLHSIIEEVREEIIKDRKKNYGDLVKQSFYCNKTDKLLEILERSDNNEF